MKVAKITSEITPRNIFFQNFCIFFCEIAFKDIIFHDFSRDISDAGKPVSIKLKTETK